MACGTVDVARKNDCVTARERKGHNEERVCDWKEEGGLWISLLEVGDLAAGAVWEK